MLRFSSSVDFRVGIELVHRGGQNFHYFSKASGNIEIKEKRITQNWFLALLFLVFIVALKKMTIDT